MDISELKSSGGPGHQGAPQYCKISFQVFDRIPTVNIRENHLLLLAGGGKRNHFKLCASILLLTRPGIKGNWLPGSNLRRHYQSLPDLGVGTRNSSQL